jgi:hypothetical protein
MWQVQIYSSTSQNPNTAQVKPNTLLYSSNLKSRADVNAITPNSVFFDIDFPSTFTPANGTWYVLVLLCISGTWDYSTNMIYVNCLDTRPDNIFGQWTGSTWHDLSSGYYNCIAFQLQYVSGGGSGGCNCDWNGSEIDNPITVSSAYLKLYNYQSDANNQPDNNIWSWSVRDWLYGGDERYNSSGQSIGFSPKPPGADGTTNIGVKLQNNNPIGAGGGWWNHLHNIAIFGSASTGSLSGSPALGVTKHFFIRGDFVVRGPLNSHEGIIVLHGNGVNRVGNLNLPATPRDFKTGWHIGWGPRTGTPFIWLAEGGDYTNGQGGNSAAGTLLIVTNRATINENNPAKLPTFTSNAYQWGHLEAGNITAHENLSVKSAILDGNGNSGNSGDVLTSQGGGSAPTWQPPSGSGGVGGVQKGSVTTNSNGEATIGFSSGTFPSGYTPTIVCTTHDSLGRSITAVVTSSSNTGFTVKTFLVDAHKHKIGQVYNTTTNPITIAKSGKHHHYAVGTTGTTTHRHSIPNQGDHSHGITNGNVGSYNTGSTQSHTHTYTSWVAATNTNNGGSHNHSGYTDNETAHAHTFATTTSGSGNTTQDADAEHTHTFSQIPAYMRETVMYTQNGSQHSIGATMTTQQQSAQVTELYTITTVNAPIGILVK